MTTYLNSLKEARAETLSGRVSLRRRPLTPPKPLSRETPPESWVENAVEAISYNLHWGTLCREGLEVNVVQMILNLFESAQKHPTACSVAKLTLLIHASKADWSADGEFAMFVEEISEIQIIDSFEVEGLNVMEFMRTALRHTGIQSLAAQTAEKISAKRCCASTPELVLITCPDTSLSGFSGINTVFMNVTTWRQRFLGTRFELKAKGYPIDIAIFALHELCHVYLRQIENNLNASTPQIMKLSTYKPKTPSTEAGRMAEGEYFHGPPRRFANILDVPMNKEWADAFVTAIHENAPLPEFKQHYGGEEKNACLECSGTDWNRMSKGKTIE